MNATRVIIREFDLAHTNQDALILSNYNQIKGK